MRDRRTGVGNPVRVSPRFLLVFGTLAAAGCGGEKCRGGACTDGGADGGPTDAGTDAGEEAGTDAGHDAGHDAGADAGFGPCGPGVVLCNEAEEAGFWALGPAYGRGASWVDVDGDGWEDLWQCDTGTGYPDHPRTSALWQNQGDGTYEVLDVGIDPGLMHASWAGSWGDYDNDGDPDLFLTNGGYSEPGPLVLYRNDLATDGRLTDVTEEAGLAVEWNTWWNGSFADFDNDGLLDLVVTCINGPLLLYRNLGDGSFAEESDALGLGNPEGDTKNPVWFDYDDDGDPDLYVASDTDHRLYRNDGLAGFADVTVEIFDPIGITIPVFSAAAADFDQDGREDLYLGRWDQADFILLNEGGGEFRPVGPDVGIDKVPPENTMGLTVGDLDADGFPEVFLGPGYPWEEVAPMIFCNEGLPLSFSRCSDDVVAGHGESRNHGIVLADPDHDGDTDFFWNLGGHVEYDLAEGTDSTRLPAFYVQYPAEPPKAAIIHLVGTTSNRDGIGARIRVEGGETRWYWRHGMQGFPGQSSDWLQVSLSGADVGTVWVFWPSGAESEVEVASGDRIEIVE